MLKANFHTKVLWIGMEENYDNLPFLRKYAPKYYSKVDYDISDFKNNQVLFKTRLIKILRSANIQEYTNDKKELLLKALKSKSKCLKKLTGLDVDAHYYFPHITQYTLSVGSLSSWKSFLSMRDLKSLTIEFSLIESENSAEAAQNTKAILCLNWRFWAHLSEMKKLSHVYCNVHSIIDSSICRFLEKFGTRQERFLSSLKTFSLFLNLLEDKISSNETFNFEQLLRHVTSFKTNELTSSIFTRFLGDVQVYKNLDELNILQVMNISEGANPQGLFKCIKNVQFLGELKTLELCLDFSSFQDFTSFLESFSLPVGIKNIRLSFNGLNFDDDLGSISGEKSTLFEKKKFYANFYDRWKNLQNLHSLSFTFLESPNNNPQSELSFILPVLKSLSRVTSLSYSSWSDIEHENKENLINFQSLWNSLVHLRSTLEILYFESSFISIQDITFENQDESCALKTLSLSGTIIGENKLLNLFKLFGNYKLQTCQLFLEGLLIRSKEYLEGFLMELMQIPREVRTSLDVNLAKIDSKDLIEALCSKDLKIKQKETVKVRLSNTPRLTQSSLNQILKSFEKSEISCCMKISDRKGKVLFLGDNLA